MKHKLSFPRIVIISICISLVFTFVSSPVAAAPIQPTLLSLVKIGVVYPYTGALAYWGEEGIPFWQQAELDINALPAAVSQGIQFQLIPLSSDSTPLGAQIAAEDLVVNHGVQAIIGFPTSLELSAAIGFLTQEHIAVISPSSTGLAPELRQVDNVFRIMPNELYMARHMADMIMAQGYTKVAIIHVDNGWGNDYAGELAFRLQNNGCLTESVVIPQWYPGLTSYAAEVAALATKVGNLGADSQTAVAMVVGNGEDLILLNDAMPLPVLSVRWFSALGGPALLNSTFNGLYYPAASSFAYGHNIWAQENYPPANPLANSLMLQAEMALGRKPRYTHVYMYDAVQIMARAILQSGTYDANAIALKIPSAAMTYNPATGPFYFDVSGDRDSGDLAYTCMLPAGGVYEYHYCGYFYGDAASGFFDFPTPPQPRDREWLP